LFTERGADVPIKDIADRDVALLMTVQIYTCPEQSHASGIARVAAIILDGLRAHR
jgi:hypothetical protein